jgi:hypothetical protein
MNSQQPGTNANFGGGGGGGGYSNPPPKADMEYICAGTSRQLPSCDPSRLHPLKIVAPRTRSSHENLSVVENVDIASCIKSGQSGVRLILRRDLLLFSDWVISGAV